MEKEKLSIKKISELTGYSVATVSRVINKNGRFSKETEQKIRKVIDEHGYIPDIAAKSLRTNNSRIIGVIVPSLVNELFSMIYNQIQNSLLTCGYTTVIYSTQEPSPHSGVSRTSLVPILKALNVSGVIVLSVRKKYESLEHLNVPVVYIDCGNVVHSGPAAFIDYDMEQGGKLIAEKLIECGCKNIVAMTNPLTPPDCPYLLGVSAALKAHNLKLNCDPRLFVASSSFEGVRECVGDALDSGLTFDALIAAKDGEAAAASYAILERGLNIPNDVRITGCDDTSVAVNTILPLTTVHVDAEQIGTLAVDCMIDMLSQTSRLSHSHLIPLWIVERATT